MSSVGLISGARSEFHNNLVTQGVLTVENGIASNADRANSISKRVAANLASALAAQHTKKAPGQTLGTNFELAVKAFLDKTKIVYAHPYPSDWTVFRAGQARAKEKISDYTPFQHLDDLERFVRDQPELLAALGNSYNVSPDVFIIRKPLSDQVINKNGPIVDKNSALLSPMRASNEVHSPGLIHAVISCKWTMRSDRAQNSRLEALNLLRNRKGRAPHIVVVTAEPIPSRIGSLALGTGDIDMVYHIALPELLCAVEQEKNSKTFESLKMLIDSDRLRDISDLPIDLIL